MGATEEPAWLTGSEPIAVLLLERLNLRIEVVTALAELGQRCATLRRVGGGFLMVSPVAVTTVAPHHEHHHQRAGQHDQEEEK